MYTFIKCDNSKEPQTPFKYYSFIFQMRTLRPEGYNDFFKVTTSVLVKAGLEMRSAGSNPGCLLPYALLFGLDVRVSVLK